jgi:hypothetical protein
MFGKLVEEFGELEKRLAYYQEKLEALATTRRIRSVSVC